MNGEWILQTPWPSLVLGALLISALLSRRTLSHCLLALGIACSLYRQWLLTLQMTGENLPHYLVRSSYPLQLLVIVLLYWYVCALTVPGFRLGWRQARHLAVPAVGILWYAGLLLWGPPSLFHPGPELDRERIWRLAVRLIVAVPYLVRSQKLVDDTKLRARDSSSAVAELGLNWLSLLLYVIYGVLAVDLADVMTGPGVPLWRLVPTALFLALFLISYFSIKHSAAFELQKREEERLRPEAGAARSLLSAEDLEKLKERVRLALERDRLYLDPELRLSTLADAVKLKPYRLSEVVRRAFDTSFYDLINGCRLRRAQALLTDPKFAHLNLFGVALESGFRSKSVFNETFKKQTGVTPSEYRRRSGNDRIEASEQPN